MQGQTPHEEGVSASSGRHRKPGSRARRRVPFVMAGILALVLIAGVVFVQLNRAPDAQQAGRVPGTPSAGATSASAAVPSDATTSAPPSPSGSTAGPGTTTPTVTASGTPSASTSTTSPPARAVALAGPRPRAAALGARLDEALAEAAPGALIATAPLGENVWTRAGTQSAGWEATALPNGLTVARNNDLALRAGKVTATTAVRGPSGPVDVRTGDAVVRLRRESATDTAKRMSDVDGPSCSNCAALRLTSAAATTIAVATTTGDVVVPAWSFGVQGSKVRLIRAALSPQSLIEVSRPYRGALPSDVESAQLPLWKVAVGKDDRTITANLDRREVAERKGCWRLQAVQSNRSVSLYASTGRADASGTCADERGGVAVRLASVLGSRVLLDSYWERALPAR